MPKSDPADVLLERPDQPLRVSTAVIRIEEGAHEITLHMDGKSVKITADSAVVIASTEHRPAACTTKTC